MSLTPCPDFQHNLKQAWSALADRIQTWFGMLDILVNNAGFGKFSSIADTTLAQST
jgi:short-subunit dehydrogenase